MEKYEVLSVLGEGAYGVVLKCRRKDTAELVAIKKFKNTKSPSGHDTTMREVALLQRLRHPNIVSLHDAFRRKGKLYLVCEYMDRNLLSVLQTYPDGLWRWPHVVRTMVYQLVCALAFCHDHSVLHRDIKPENLLVKVHELTGPDPGQRLSDEEAQQLRERDRDEPPNMTLKLCDFGFARRLHNSSKSQDSKPMKQPTDLPVGLQPVLTSVCAQEDFSSTGTSASSDADAMSSCHGDTSTIKQECAPVPGVAQDAAAVSRPDGGLTQYVATRWYRAPELLLGQRDYGPATDMWAVACIMGEIADGNPLLPGRDELDQLVLTAEHFGPLTQEQAARLPGNDHLGPEYSSSQQRKVDRMIRHASGSPAEREDMARERAINFLFDRFENKLDADGLDFMQQLLDVRPDARLTAAQCLEHPYLADLHDQYRRCAESPEDITSRAHNPSTRGAAVGRSSEEEVSFPDRAHRDVTSGSDDVSLVADIRSIHSRETSELQLAAEQASSPSQWCLNWLEQSVCEPQRGRFTPERRRTLKGGAVVATNPARASSSGHRLSASRYHRSTAPVQSAADASFGKAHSTGLHPWGADGKLDCSDTRWKQSPYGQKLPVPRLVLPGSAAEPGRAGVRQPSCPTHTQPQSPLSNQYQQVVQLARSGRFTDHAQGLTSKRAGLTTGRRDCSSMGSPRPLHEGLDHTGAFDHTTERSTPSITHPNSPRGIWSSGVKESLPSISPRSNSQVRSSADTRGAELFVNNRNGDIAVSSSASTSLLRSRTGAQPQSHVQSPRARATLPALLGSSRTAPGAPLPVSRLQLEHRIQHQPHKPQPHSPQLPVLLFSPKTSRLVKPTKSRAQTDGAHLGITAERYLLSERYLEVRESEAVAVST